MDFSLIDTTKSLKELGQTGEAAHWNSSAAS